MLELLLEGLLNIARMDVALALVIGAVGGVIIGAIPGVGPAVAIAILLPATYKLDPLVGLTLLLGIYGASMYGGAIPAILINTPGTPVNALTTYDGYSMTKQGQPRRALSLAYSASFVGGMISILALITLAPNLAAIAPYFGSREIFLAALLGLVLVIVAHRDHTLAAAFLVGLGVFFATVGMEPVRLSTRFTFGISWLRGGFHLIPVVLGLFAISQAFILLIGSPAKHKMPKLTGSPFEGLLEVFRMKRVAVSSSVFGIIMGIIPGVGEFLAQFFSYNLAQKLSKTPEQFGKGSPEGLIASEAANNAVPAAAMIPLLALGIPGEALTAMMLSVFRVHNLVPGPKLFQTQQDLVVSLYLCLFITNLLILAFLLVSTPLLIRVIHVPERFLGVSVLALSLVGVYSIRNQVTDCWIATAFGLFGYVLRRVDWPLVPIILGIILGEIMEEKFRASLARVETPLDFVTRPAAATIAALIALALLSHLVAEFRSWKVRRSLAAVEP